LRLAERANLPVVRHLDLDRIDLGIGDRGVMPNGCYFVKISCYFLRNWSIMAEFVS
jgi:hypothetical protein